MPKHAVPRMFLKLTHHWGRWLLVALALAAGWFWLSRPSQVAMVPVEGVQFERDYVDTMQVYGRLSAKEEVFLAVRNGGRLDRIHGKAGDLVQAGATIAVLDQTARMSALKQALSQYRLAESEWRRVQRLQRSGSSTMQELEQTQSAYQVRRAELQTAKQNLEDAMIRAPFDGVLTFVAFREGDVVPDGSRVAVVENRQSWRLVAKVPYEQVARLAGDQAVQLAHYDPAAQKTPDDWAPATALAQRLNPGSNYDGGYVDLELTFSQPISEFQVGDSVAVRLVLARYEEVAMVPPAAIYRRDQESVVLTLRPNGEYEFLTISIVKLGSGQAVIRGLPRGTALVAPPIGKDWRQQLAKLPAAKSDRLKSRVKGG